MSDGFGYPESTPAEFHGSSRHRVPAGRVEQCPRFVGMFPRIDELQEGGVRAPTRPESMLGIGEDVMALPCPGDALDDDTHPELAEAIQRDLRRRVLGLRAEPSPLEPEGGVRESP